MDMIPKASILELIDKFLIIDKETMEDIITKDKIPPNNADAMRLTADKTASFVGSLREAVVGFPILTQTKGLDMPQDKQLEMMKKIKFLYDAVDKVTTLLKKESDLALTGGELLNALAKRVEKLEKQVELVGRRN